MCNKNLKMKKIVLTNYMDKRIITGLLTGAVVQLVRAPACHAGSCEFDSRQSRIKTAIGGFCFFCGKTRK